MDRRVLSHTCFGSSLQFTPVLKIELYHLYGFKTIGISQKINNTPLLSPKKIFGFLIKYNKKIFFFLER